MIDWNQKRPEQRGVVIEGRDDQIVLQAFLTAGEALGLWESWEAKLYFSLQAASTTFEKKWRMQRIEKTL